MPIKFILSVLCLFYFSLEAKPIKKKKYNLSVCAIFKNESKNIREWIEYHRLVGVDHFYLYENGASDRYMKVLRPYVNRKIITLVPWPNLVDKKEGEDLFKWVLSTQVTAYENVLHLYAKAETQWIVFLDIDEFLVPMQDGLLPQLLESCDSYSGVALSCEYFDASTAGPNPSRSLVIEAIDLTKAPKVDSLECVKKIIFKPDHYVGFSWPPYECVFANNEKAHVLEKGVIRINRYLNRNVRSLNFRRKLYVDNRKIQDAEIEELLNSGFDIEDQQRAIQRFVPDLVKQLSAFP